MSISAWTSACIRRAGIVVLGLVLFPALAPQAHALYEGFYEWSSAGTCHNTSVCGVNFGSVPAGKYLNLTSVSCRFTATGSVALMSAYVASTGANSSRTYLTPIQQHGNFGTARNFTTTTAIMKHYGPYGTPRAVVQLVGSVGTITMNCSAGGRW